MRHIQICPYALSSRALIETGCPSRLGGNPCCNIRQAACKAYNTSKPVKAATTEVLRVLLQLFLRPPREEFKLPPERFFSCRIPSKTNLTVLRSINTCDTPAPSPKTPSQLDPCGHKPLGAMFPRSCYTLAAVAVAVLQSVVLQSDAFLSYPGPPPKNEVSRPDAPKSKVDGKPKTAAVGEPVVGPR